ncbi:hypothetical protein ES707_14269 [subsurface metagenome]
MFEYVIDILKMERDMLKTDSRYYGVKGETKKIIKEKTSELKQAIKILEKEDK